MISLPAKWIKKKGLKKGDELNVKQNEDNLVLSLDKKTHKTETTINLTSLEESSIRTILTNAYRLGYDKINLTYGKEEILKSIKILVEKNLLGFEVTNKESNKCVIESITEPALDQFDNIFSKVFMNIEEMFEVGENILKGERQEFEDLNRKILQLDNFCKRVLVKNSLFENNFLQWNFHSSLIHASRELYHLFKYLSNSNFKASKIELELLGKVKEVFEIIREAYSKKDLSLLEGVHKIEKLLSYKDGYSALKKTKDPIVVNHILVSAKHFYLANSPLMGILIR